MRAIRFYEAGGPEVLRIEELEAARPGPGEVQLRVKAIGLNRADALFRAASYIEQPVFPSGLGLEAAGYVERLGEGVSGLKEGDAVSVAPSWSMAKWPAYCELATFPARLVIKHPPTLGFTEAAAIWMQYLTAYGALVDVAKLARGDVVVITAASSSVGLAAIQLANMVGAIPVAITRTSAKRAALLDAGAAEVVATAEEDLLAALAMAVGPQGARVVFDAVGGESFDALTAAMSPGGVLIQYGGLSPDPTPFPLFNVLSKRLTLRGYLMHEVVQDPHALERARAFIFRGLEMGSLKPVIARTFPFDRIVDAHRFLESNQQFGKIVVTL